MAEPKISKPKLTSIKPGTPEMAAYLEVGYGMSLERAKAIIKERTADPHTHPYELYEKAQAMLAAYNAKPEVIDTVPGWKRGKPLTSPDIA